MERSRDATRAPGLSLPSRKILGLGAFVVLAVVGYTILWFYLAGQLQSRVETLIAGLQGRGIVASCDALDVRGYPFRIGVFCDGVSAETLEGEATGFSSAAFRSAAQIYRPGHIVSEVDGPVVVTGPEVGTVNADWESLQASTVFGTGGLSRASVEARTVTADWTAPALGPVQLGAETVALHTRENGPDVDLALSTNGAQLKIDTLAATLPAMDLSGTARVEDGAGFLAGRTISVEELRGTRGDLTEIAATIEGGGALRLSGPFEIAEDGEISGRFDVVIDDLERWSDLLTSVLPQTRSFVDGAGGVLSALGGSDGQVSVQLNVDDGRVALGFIPIGRIPPI